MPLILLITLTEMICLGMLNEGKTEKLAKINTVKTATIITRLVILQPLHFMHLLLELRRKRKRKTP